MYIDLSGKSEIKNLKNPGEVCHLNYTVRGWSNHNAYKVDGTVFNASGKAVYKIEGKWNDKVYIVNVESGEKEMAWQKSPYPENWELMYGMSHVSL